MDSLGTIGSYALSVQQMQMNLIKMQNNLQKQAIEILLENSQNVPVSENLGHHIDITA